MDNSEQTKTAAKKGPVSSKIKKSSSKLEAKHKIVIGIIIIFAAAITAVVGLDNSFKLTAARQESLRNKNKIQAVFLTNGQVYFGHMSKFGFKYWKIENAHYLKTEQVPVTTGISEGQATTTQMTTQAMLVKASQDLHSPEGTIYIPDSNILYWQNLRSDSSISKAILENKIK